MEKQDEKSTFTYKLMSGHKVPTVSDAWLRLTSYNYSQRKYAWVNEQHELILVVNRHAVKHIMQSVKKTTFYVGDSTHNIPKGNLLLLWDHPKG